MPGLLLRHEDCHIWKKIFALLTPFLEGDLAGGGVNHGVTCALQPGLGLFLERFKVGIWPVRKEVLLDILDAVLYLALRFGISRTAEHRLEQAATYISIEHLRHDVVSDVLISQEYSVLVVDDFPRDAVEVLECLLVRLYGGL